MYSQHRAAILLRKFAGRFDAVRRGAGALVTPMAGSPLGGLALLSSPAAVAVGWLLLALLAVAFVLSALQGVTPSFAAETTAPLGLALVGQTEEVKKIKDDIMAAFETFKASNDQALAELKKNGAVDPLLQNAVDKANTDITALTAKLHEVEKLAARPQFEAAQSKEQIAAHNRIREFLAAQRALAPDEVEVTSEIVAQMDEYQRDMRAFLRKGKVSAAMSVGSGPDGGYGVSPDKSGRIVELVYESSPMRALADVQTTISDTYGGGTDLDEAGSGWVGETQSRTETDTPQVGEWSIPVHELYAEPQTTQKNLDDNIRDPESWLAKKVAAKFARDEAAAFVAGNGIKKPSGILGYAHASAPTVANWKRVGFIKTGVSADWAATNKGDKIIDLIHTLKSAYRAGAIFFGNTLTIASARKLKNEVDGTYLFQPDVVNGFMGRLHGHLLVDFPDMPDIAADSYSLGFGNLKEGYTIVDRLGIRVLRDPLTKKGWVKFYTTKRVGGDVTNFEAIKLLKFGT